MEFSDFITVAQVPDVVLKKVGQSTPVKGLLCVTGHHLILANRGEIQEEVYVPHRNVDLVEYKNLTELTLYCKDFQVFKLSFPSKATEECAKVAGSIGKLSNIGDVNLLYPFYHANHFQVLEDGWLAFTPYSEFAKYRSSPDFRVTDINRNFQACETYPSQVVVPKSIDDEMLCKAATFRQLNRFPVLSYLHKASGTYLVRCSQMVSSTKRCKEDEALLNAYVISGKRAFIIDTRTFSPGRLNKSKDTDSNYPLWKRIARPVMKWSVLQESFTTFIEVCRDESLSTEKFLSKLHSSHWLDYVRDLMICACVVSTYIHKEDATVLVQGSAGIDRTLQVTSLSQVILDPDCRTIRGFEALIEREWIQGGHPFKDRCCKSVYSKSDKKTESPVFLLFLDSVWQIWQQFPCSFEFNEQFLILLFENAYCSKYGTFLGNNQKERQRYKLHEQTTSMWSYVNIPEFLELYLNPLYEPNDDVIFPSVAPQSLAIWKGLYMRYIIDSTPHTEVWDRIKHIKEKNSSLQLKASRLRRQIDVLSKELQEEGISTSEALVRNGEQLP